MGAVSASQTEADAAAGGVGSPAKHHGRVARILVRNRTAVAGGAVLLIIVFGVMLAPVLAPYNPTELDLGAQFQRPLSPGHLLGTDSLGRDVLSRLLWGGRISLAMALGATVISMGAGVPLGLAVGFYGGVLDATVMRAIDVLLAFPYLLLAIVIVGALGPGLTNAMLAVAISGIPFYIRLVRGLVLSVRHQQHVEAARALGAFDGRIIARHILPMLYPYLIVFFALNAGYIVLQASSLSFLGLGAQPPSPEWGALLAENRQYVTMAPYSVLIPGAAILLVVLAFNSIGDALRDVLDVTLSE